MTKNNTTTNQTNQNSSITTHYKNNKIPPKSTTTIKAKSSGGATAQACSACKYQRRKCNPDCPLAPYFPANRNQEFMNVHRLFGVSNILKILRELEPSMKKCAVDSIIYQANVRAADPVGGCLRVRRDLEVKLMHAEAELDLVLHQLSAHRAHAHAAALAQQEIEALKQGMENPHFDGNASSISADPLSVYAPMQGLQAIEYPCPIRVRSNSYQQQMSNEDEYNGPENEHALSYGSLHQAFAAIKVDSEGSSSCSSSVMQGKQQLMDESKDIKPILGNFQEKQIQLESKELIQSSEQVVMVKDVDAAQVVEENDLKGAASLFSLTNK